LALNYDASKELLKEKDTGVEFAINDIEHGKWFVVEISAGDIFVITTYNDRKINATPFKPHADDRRKRDCWVFQVYPDGRFFKYLLSAKTPVTAAKMAIA
jgi:hypothetical protein